MDKPILTARQTADLLQCGLSTVYEMAGERGCPVIRIGKVGLRFERAALLEWLRKRGKQKQDEHLAALPPLRR